MQREESVSREQDFETFHFFLFINTRSGFGEGKEYLQHNFSQIKYKYESSRTAFIYLCDLFNAEEKEKNINFIKELYDQKHPNIRVVVSGGDGTILWVVSEVMKAGVDVNKVAFVINPIGTGNDFSRSLGWGHLPLIKTGKDCFRQELAKQVLVWMNSIVGKYDLWDVELQTYENGEIYDVKNQVEIRREERQISKIFCNYVGMGLDARIVYTVERRRTNNAFVNKVIYGCVGFCNFFKRLKNLDTLSFMHEGEDNSEKKSEAAKGQSLLSEERSTNLETEISDAEDLVKTTKGLQIHKRLSNNEEQTVYHLKKGYRGMVCLNCTSYMCGITDIWSTHKIAEQNSTEENFDPQSFNDGKVEFVVYKNQLDLALERVLRKGSKFAQVGGPFTMEFKQETLPEKRQTFIQIDGQSIKVIDLKSLRIKKTQKIEGSQLNILVNRPKI